MRWCPQLTGGDDDIPTRQDLSPFVRLAIDAGACRRFQPLAGTPGEGLQIDRLEAFVDPQVMNLEALIVESGSSMLALAIQQPPLKAHRSRDHGEPGWRTRSYEMPRTSEPIDL